MKILFLMIRVPVFVLGGLILGAAMFLHILWIAAVLLFVPVLWLVLWLPFQVFLGALSNDATTLKKSIQTDVHSCFSGGEGGAARIIKRHHDRIGKLALWFIDPEALAGRGGKMGQAAHFPR